MALQAQYASTVKSPFVQATTANTARDGTGTLATLYTAGANGGRVDAINLNAVAVTTAGMLRLFLSDGVNNRLILEVPVQVVVASGVVAAWSTQLRNLGICLQAGYLLKISTNNAETFNACIVQGGDF